MKIRENHAKMCENHAKSTENARNIAKMCENHANPAEIREISVKCGTPPEESGKNQSGKIGFPKWDTELHRREIFAIFAKQH